MWRSKITVAICSHAVRLGAAAFCLALLCVGTIRYYTQLTTEQFAIVDFLVACFLVALVLSLRLRVEHKANLALTLVSTVMTLYLVELLMTFKPVPEVASEVAKQLGRPFDSRTRMQVVHDLRRKGIKAYPDLSGPQLRKLALDVGGKTILPLSPSIARATIVFCNETGEYRFQKSDEHGFDNPPGLWKNESVDIVLIGDSFVRGICVESELTIAGRMRSRWPGVVNLGVSGASPMLELAVLREFGPRLRPQVVLWIFYEGNDLFDLDEEYQIPVLRRYLAQGEYTQDIRKHQTEIDEQMARQIDAIIQDHELKSKQKLTWSEWGHQLLSVVRLQNVRDVIGLGISIAKRDSLLGPLPEIMERAKSTVGSWGGKLYFVYLPTYQRYNQWVGEGVVGHKEVVALMEELGTPVIDMAERFGNHGNPKALWVHPRGHYTVEGYGVVAEAITEALASDASLNRLLIHDRLRQSASGPRSSKSFSRISSERIP